MKILYDNHMNRYLRVVWVGLTRARLQDNKGRNHIVSIKKLNQLINLNYEN